MGNITEKGSSEIKDILSLMERVGKRDKKNKFELNVSDVENEVGNFNRIVAYQNCELNESNVNRMLSWLKKCDCAFITAFRSKLVDVKHKSKTYFGKNNEWDEGHVFTHEENRNKNKMLYSELVLHGYGVSKCKGVYPEGMNSEVSEESYFVVNLHNKKNFFEDLLRLGEYFNQDSIYYKEAGNEVGYLIGTNNSSVPGYHQIGEASKLKLGYASNYMSRIGNKAFAFVQGDSKQFDNKQDAMNDIEQSKGGEEEYTQRYWMDSEGTSFQKRKQQRIDNNLNECVEFWRNIITNEMHIVETIHPLTKKEMCGFLHSMKPKVLC